VKVVILAGGLGTRLAEETDIKPKPMVEIGRYPILWHIMKHYAHYGFTEFYIALGYKGELIKRYFIDYYTFNGNMTIHLNDGKIELQNQQCENWILHLIDTGLNTMTGGRLKRLEQWLKNDTFMLTYGDGVANVDLDQLLRFHKSHGQIGTVTAVHPPARFGELVFNGDLVSKFTEKPQLGEGWINGGFMIFEPAVFNYIKGDETNLEADVLPVLASSKQLVSYRHNDFWQCMDTMRDVRLLNSLWQGGKPPWKVW
jgi:glucose-1-phosphate cytidylyltransferase